MWNKLHAPISVPVSIAIVLLFTIAVVEGFFLYVEKTEVEVPQVIYQCVDNSSKAKGETSFKTLEEGDMAISEEF